jgi:hypothetical protein
MGARKVVAVDVVSTGDREMLIAAGRNATRAALPRLRDLFASTEAK